MTLFEDSGTHAAEEGGYGSPAAAQNEGEARVVRISTTGTHAAVEQGAARRSCYGWPSVAKEHNGGSHVLADAGQNADGVHAVTEKGVASRGYGCPVAAENESGATDLVSVARAAVQNGNGTVYLEPDTPAASMTMNLHGTAAELGFSGTHGGEMFLYNTHTAAAATGTGAACYSSGMVATGGDLTPVAQGQVLVGKATGDPATVIGQGKGGGGSFAERMRDGLPLVGLAAAGAAATGLAPGAASPVTGFTMFMMLLGGLSLLTIHVLRA